MEFREWNLHEDLLRGIEGAGYAKCMPVQEMTLSQTLQGIDVLVQSQTGSGKTAAFIVSVFQLFLEGKRHRTLAIVPTRELAVQIEEEATLLGKYLDFKIASFYGGVGYFQQEKDLEEGVDIIIGTPGRLIDLNQSKKLNFQEIDILIIDEADRLFDMGFLPDIRRMLKKMKRNDERHTMLFSATLNERVRQLALEYMNNPADITINPETLTVDNITQELYHVGRSEKINLLIGLLRRYNPNSVLIFTNTKQTAFETSHRLEVNGFKSKYIIGDLPQSKRLKIIDDMKSGKIPFLVATDVAARGLHINDLELVVNYDLPEDCENYVHRIGRTARAGKSGKAISFACERFVYGLEASEKFINMKIPVVWADDSLFADDMSKGKYFSLEKGKQKDPEWKEDRPAKLTGEKKAKKDVRPETKEKKRQTEKKTADNKKYRDKAKETAMPESVRKGPLKKRLEYYSEKYGEDFSVPAKAAETQVAGKSLWERLKGFLKRKDGRIDKL